MKYYSIRWKNGNTVVLHDSWENVKEKVIGVNGVTFKGHDTLEDAEAWTNKPTVPYRRAGDPYKKDTIYLFVDGSFSQKRQVSGWGWVAVVNDQKIGEGNGVISHTVKSRNICGELRATIEAVRWYVSNRRDLMTRSSDKPVIVHDYSGIGNWALGYWQAKEDVAVEYQMYIQQYVNILDFEKVGGHSGIKWNDYADELTRKGY